MVEQKTIAILDDYFKEKMFNSKKTLKKNRLKITGFLFSKN